MFFDVVVAIDVAIFDISVFFLFFFLSLFLRKNPKPMEMFTVGIPFSGAITGETRRFIGDQRLNRKEEEEEEGERSRSHTHTHTLEEKRPTITNKITSKRVINLDR